MCCSSRIRKATVLLPSGVRKIIKLVQLNLEACGTTQLPWRLLQSPHASKHKGMFRCNPRIQSVTAGALHQLQLVQIELQGQYSRTRLCSFHAYLINTFTFKRLVAVLFVTPWPSIATIVLMEVIPLNPPSAGVQGNIVFWGRFAGFTVIESICYIAMTHLGVRLLDLTPLQRLISAICGSAAAIGAGYICAIDIGFPVPFMVTTTAVPCLLALWTSMGVFSIRRILTDPAAVASLKEWVYVCVIVATQLFIYPLYYHIFGLASPLGQSALSIVLGVVKIGYRFAIGSVVKQQADYRPEIVTITTEIYHAMFVSFSMQNAASLMTVAVLLIVDLLHSSSVIYEVNIMCHRLEALDRTIRPPTSRAGSSVDRAMALVSRYHSSDGPVATTIESLGFRNSRKNRTNRCNCGCLRRKSLLMMKNTTKISVVPTLQPIRPISIHGASSNQHYPKLAKPKIAKDIGAAEAEYIAITLRILHLTEFTMLGELVEFVVPTIFTFYTIAMVNLPNRVYCPQLAGIDAGSIGGVALRMLTYSLLELLSLVVIDWILRMRLGFSPIAQLAMVLETHWASLQGGFVMWVGYTVQGLFEHYGQWSIVANKRVNTDAFKMLGPPGSDFSFQFVWLHNSTTEAA